MNRSFSQFIHRCTEVVLAGFFVTLFIPLKLRLFEPDIFLSGDFNPYNVFYLYASDAFFLLALFFIALQFFFVSHKTDDEILNEFTIGDWPIILFFGLLIAVSLISFFVVTASSEMLLFSWRWVEMLGLYYIVSRNILPLATIARFFVWAMILQSIMAGFQYFHGSSLGLSFLGEPLLHIGEPGIATMTMLSKTILRGYGTFLHPNIFAAYAIFGVFLSLLYRKTRPVFFSVAIGILVFGIIISFSRMALFALIALFILSFFSKKKYFSTRVVSYSLFSIVGVLMAGFLSGLFSVLVERFQFTDNAALQFRYANFIDGIHVFLNYPFGTGLGGSTTAMSMISSMKFAPWQYQPAHNFFLVMSDELGVFGLIIVLVGTFFLYRNLYRDRQSYPLHFAIGVAFLCLSLTDHYFFTLYHGQILLVLFLSFLALAKRESSPSSH